jgi:hypothetical protein
MRRHLPWTELSWSVGALSVNTVRASIVSIGESKEVKTLMLKDQQKGKASNTLRKICPTVQRTMFSQGHVTAFRYIVHFGITSLSDKSAQSAQMSCRSATPKGSNGISAKDNT